MLSASPDHVPIREAQSAADLPVSFAGGSSIVSGLPLEVGTVESQAVKNDSELAGERDLGRLRF